MSMLRLTIMLAIALATTFGGATNASAQNYPTRTVRFILPFGPGSGTDTAARVVADRLSARWNMPVVVENRPGGDSLVSINAFISANDDHTLLWMPVGNFAVHPFEHEKLSYDADRDLLPIANVTTLPLSASAPASLSVGSLREFVELVRSQPNKFNAAAASGSADFLMGGFLQSNGLQMAKIPYRDIMQGPGDLAEGRLQLLMSSFTIVQPLMQAGRIKVLAVTSRQRAPNAPDVPTMAEAGFPAFQLDSPGGLFGPRGMPLSLRERIAEDVRVAASDPIVAARLQATSQVLTILGPAEFAANIKSIQDKIATFAKATGRRPSR
jgi:tripartite-type tricarboxylate transporter receptor subunit TctC